MKSFERMKKDETLESKFVCFVSASALRYYLLAIFIAVFVLRAFSSEDEE